MGDKGDVQEDKGQPFQKGGDNSLWDGPVKKRCCTDIACIPIFLAHIVCFWILTFMNAGTGNPMKLIKPMDFKGQFCGINAEGQWNNGTDLTTVEKQMWSMNLDEIFEGVAKDLACSQVGYGAVVSPGLSPSGVSSQNKLTKEQWSSYCGKPVDAFQAIQGYAEAASALQDSIAGNISQFTDPNKAFNLFAKGPTSIGTSIMKEITKYSNLVCTSTCDLGQATVDPARKYIYSPPPNAIWGSDSASRAIGLWSRFVSEVTQTQPDLVAPLTFKAWSKSACPYEDKYCVPTPGVTFTEAISGLGACMPKIDSGVLNAVGSATGTALEGLGKLSVTEDAQRTFGDVMGDIMETWQVFVIVAVCSLVIGLLMLLLMRFIIEPVVWCSLLLVFLIFVAGGLLIIMRSGQCADQSFEDAANAMKASATNSTGTGSNPFDVECAGGYMIESDDARTWTKIAGYVVLGIAGLWALAVICMSCRIRLAIQINKVACLFIVANPSVILVPIFQNIVGIIWIFLWVFCATFLLSQVSEDIVPKTPFATYNEAYGTPDQAGKCTGEWPPGGVYLDQFSADCINSNLCYRCSAPRFWFDWKFGYSFLSFLWHNFFIVAVGQCTVAGAVGIWFFTPSGEKWKRSSVAKAFCNTLIYHTGSLAFGSLVLAIVVWIKWFMTWLAQQAKQAKNKVMEFICKCLAYCLWCFEKCVKFLNKNAYIQIALMGTNFCTSAKNAFKLILRNFLRFGVIVMLSHIVHFIGMVLITAATAIAGYFILGAMYEDVNPVAPTICYVFIGWMAAKLFIGTFGLAVDATLHCFIAAEEMDAGNEFAPGPLKGLLNALPDKAGEQRQCDGCCCTIM